MDWKMDWYGGIDHGMDYGIYSKYPTLLCIYSLTNLLVAHSALY